VTAVFVTALAVTTFVTALDVKRRNIESATTAIQILA
jgi:hypothetical protein